MTFSLLLLRVSALKYGKKPPFAIAEIAANFAKNTQGFVNAAIAAAIFVPPLPPRNQPNHPPNRRKYRKLASPTKTTSPT